MRSWIGTKKRPFLVAAFALLAAAVAIFIQIAPSNAVIPSLVTSPSISATGTTMAYSNGKVITANPGVWNDSPTSYTYQWYRCTSTATAGLSLPTNCQTIYGSTSATHTLSRSDIGFYVIVKVNAVNADGTSSPAYSASTIQIRQSNAYAFSYQGLCEIRSGRLYCAGANGSNYTYTGQGFSGSGNWGQAQTTFYGPIATASGSVLTNLVSVASSWTNTCVLTLGGNIYCMGSSTGKQFGDGYGSGLRQYMTPVLESDGSPVANAISISVGDGVFCYLKSTDTNAYCTGNNGSGQLGQGNTTTTYTSPQKVLTAAATPLAGVIQITAGATGTSAAGSVCALATDGTTVGAKLYCWGQNDSGQLGFGDTLPTHLYAASVTSNASSTGFSQVTVGSNTCAIQDSGVYCWGGDDNGQQGRGTVSATPRLSPASPTTTSTGLSMASGNGWIQAETAELNSNTVHTCFLNISGAVFCAGANSNYQLDSGATTNLSTARLTNGLASGITDLDVANTGTCGFALSTGTLKCIGQNTFGQFATGAVTSLTTATAISAPVGTFGTAINVPSNLTAGISGNNAVGGTLTDASTWLGFPYPTLSYQWYACASAVSSSSSVPGGCNAIAGATFSSYQPTQAESGLYISALVTATSEGGSSTKMLTASNPIGVLPGVTTAATVTTPVSSIGAAIFQTFTATGATWDGTASPIGTTSYQWYRCYNSGTATTTIPSDCSAIYGATASTYRATKGEAGQYLRVGEVYTSTAGSITSLSSTTDQLRAASQLIVNDSGFCGTQFGKLYCWGFYAASSTGRSAPLTSNTLLAPTPVVSADNGDPMTDVVQVSSTQYSGCALKVNRTLWCWGVNKSGNLGNGSSIDGTINATEVVTNPTTPAIRWSQVATSGISGYGATCAIDTTGAIWCTGQLTGGIGGDGTTTPKYAFTKTTNSQLTSGVIQIAANANYSTASDAKAFCALKNTGRVFCWGMNINGVLGDGSATGGRTTSLFTPYLLDSKINYIGMGSKSACALKQGQLLCWGTNTSNHLSPTNTTNVLSPIPPATSSFDTSRGIVDVAVDGYGATNSSIHLCALNYQGAVACVGANSSGQMNLTGDTASKTVLTASARWSANVTSLAISTTTTCAVINGNIQCAGTPWAGLLGTGYASGYSTTVGPINVKTFVGTAGVLDQDPSGMTVSTSQNFVVGNTVTSTTSGDAYPTPTSTYAWYSCTTGGGAASAVPGDCTAISGATTSTYTVAAGDAGAYLRVAVTLTNLSGTTTKVSAAGQVGSAPTLSSTPSGTITTAGSLKLLTNQLITAPSLPTVIGSPTPTTTIKWHRCVANQSSWASAVPAGCYPVEGGTSASYTTTHGDDGFFLVAVYTSTSSAGTLISVSPSTTRVIYANNFAMGTYGAYCAIKLGKVYCWGLQYSGYGTLGNRHTGVVNNTFAITTPPTAPIQMTNGKALSGVISISMNGYTACAVTYSGLVYCWGAGTSGLLGDGTTTHRWQAAPVLTASNTPLTGVTRVGLGDANGCAINSSNGVVCWGANTPLNGGIASTYATSSIGNLTTDVQQISISNVFGCAIQNAAVRCWGTQSYGQLSADGSSTASNVALLSPSRYVNDKLVSMTGGVSNVATSSNNTCVVKLGAVWCFGTGSTGSLSLPASGTGAAVGTSSLSPGQIMENGTSILDSDVVQVVGTMSTTSAGTVSNCAVKVGGAVYCVSATAGLVGTPAASTWPVAVTNLTSGVTDIQLSPNESCVTKSGAMNCVTLAQSYATVMLNGTVSAVPTYTPITAFSSNLGVTEQATVAGTAGISGYATLGGVISATNSDDGAGAWQGVPTPVMTNQWYVCTSAGSTTNSVPSDCTLLSGETNSTYTIAQNQTGKYFRVAVTGTNELGSATVISGTVGPAGTAPIAGNLPSLNAINAPVLSPAITISGNAGTITSDLPLTVTGQWYHCSATGVATSTAPSDCIAITGATGTSYRPGTSDITGYVRYATVGTSSAGQTIVWSETSSMVRQGNTVANSLHATCAIKFGRVYCWGTNTEFGFGNGNNTITSTATATTATPVKKSASVILEDVISISAHRDNFCAIDANGAIWCWGTNGTYYPYGNNDNLSNSYYAINPNAAADGTVFTSGVVGVTMTANGPANGSAICLWKTTGAVYCWGYVTNLMGPFSGGTIIRIPTAVPELASGVTKISIGVTGGCAVKSGSIYCYGINTNKIGTDATMGNVALPTKRGGLPFTDYVDVAVDNYTVCLIRQYGVSCLGNNTYSGIGDGSHTGVYSVTPYVHTGATGSGVNSLFGATGTSSTHCANKTNGSMYCWGTNPYGGMPGVPGDTAGYLDSPVLSTISNITSFSGHQESSIVGGTYCYTTTSAAIGCTGLNTYRSVGDGTTSNYYGTVSTAPTPFLPSDFSQYVGTEYMVPQLVTQPVVTASNTYLGTTITSNTPTAIGYPIPTTSQKWVRCNNSGNSTTSIPSDCSDITGATTASYTLPSGDLNYRHRMVFTATNSRGTTYGVTSATAPVASISASTLTKPIGGGSTLNYGETVSKGTVAWRSSRAITVVNGWLRCGNAITVSATAIPNHCNIISGATSNSYSTTQNDIGYFIAAYETATTTAGVSFMVSPTTNFVMGALETVAANPGATCVIKTGNVYCAGTNTYGELGRGNTTAVTSPYTPMPVLTSAGVSLSNVISIVTSKNTNGFCALTTDSFLYCWGYNANSTLAAGGTSQSYAVKTLGNTKVAAVQLVGASQVACAITEAATGNKGGALYCWGTNTTNGMLGNGLNTGTVSIASRALIASGVNVIAPGALGFCFTQSGALSCFGGWTDVYSTPIAAPVLSPTPVPGFNSGVTAVAMGTSNGCLVKDGGLYCWGTNESGQLGNGTTGSGTRTPTLVTSTASDGATFTSGVSNVYSNADNVTGTVDRLCALKTSGALYCWGSSNNGLLFDGVNGTSTGAVSTPKLSSVLNSGVTSVSMTTVASCAIKSGNLYCVGDSQASKLGRNLYLDGTLTYTTNQVTGYPGTPLATAVSVNPTIPSAAQAGYPIMVDAGTVFAVPTPTYAVDWFVCNTSQTAGNSLPSGCSAATGTGASTISYTPAGADIGKYLIAKVTGTNGSGATIKYSASSLVALGDQTVSLTYPGGNLAPGSNLQITAVATSGLTDFTWSTSTPDICSVDSTGLATGLAGGHCLITATQPGNASYAAASSTIDLMSERVTQTINWGNFTSVGFSATPVTISASSSSNLTLAYASSTPSVCTISNGKLVTVALGTCSLTADQAGNLSFFAATQTSKTFDIVQGANEITLIGSTIELPNGTFALPATASSGLNINYTTSSDASICTVSGSTLTMNGVGNCVVNGSQAGNTNFLPATDATATFRIVGPPESDTQVTISGSPVFGVSYGSSPGTWAGAGTITKGYQWYSCTSSGAGLVGSGNLGANAPSDCTAITGATSESFTPTAAEVGSRLRLAEQASNVTSGTTNYTSVFTAASAVVQKQSQTITFGALTSKTYGDAAISLTATSDRSLTISYSSSDTAVCTISGSTLTIVGAGSCDVTASQAGDSGTLAATSVVQTLTVAKANQTITLPAFTAGVYGGAVKASGATTTSGLTLTLTSADTAVCNVSGLNVTQVAPGACSITASQAGDSNYNAATDVTKTFTIAKASQTITFIGSTKQKPAGDFNVAASTTSGLSISYASTTASICTVSGSTVTPLGLGTCTIAASQAGDSNWNSATSVNANFIIESVPVQTASVSIASAANYRFGTAVAATAGAWTGTSTITYARAWYRCDTAPAVSVGTGTANELAPSDCAAISGAAGLTYTPVLEDIGKYLAIAENARNSTTVGGTNNRTTFVSTATVIEKQTQAITFAALTSKTFGDASFNLAATSDRSLTITYSTSNTSVCTVSGVAVTIVAAGTCDITASQSGNSTTLAATDVVRTLTVNRAAQTITLPDFTAGVYQGANKVSGATASSGLTVTLTSTTTAVCTVSGLEVVQVTAGTCSITASQSGNSNYLAATDVIKSFTIAKAAQTITFTGSAKQKPAGTFTLAGSTNSGLSIVYSSNTNSVCTVSGNVVTPVNLGNCSITAAQGGDSNWSNATSVTAIFTIESVPVQSVPVAITAAASYRFGVPVTLSAGGTWTGTSTITQAKAWYRCDTAPSITAAVGNAATVAPSDCAAISGVTGVSYTPVAADLGKYVAIADTATNTTTSGGTANRTTFVSTATVIEKQTQSITFAALTAKTFGNASFNLTATTDRTLNVSFASSNTAVCTISGVAVTITGAGTCDITASQAGNSTTLAAADVVRTLTVNKAAQTITFTGSPKQFGAGDFTVAASTTSLLPISYASSTTSVCTVSGSTVTPVALGTCTIVASQAGDNNYLAATDISASFTIESVPVQSTSVAIPSAAHYRFGTAITATAGSWTGTSVSAATRTWYRCVSAPAINSATGSASALKPADCTLISGATGLSYTPVAADIGNYLATAEAVTNTTSSGSNARTTFVATSGLVEKQTQTLTFTRPNDGTFGDADQTLIASTDRSLAVSLSSTTPSVCSVTGTTLRFLKSGSCQVWANQLGNATTEAGTQTGWTLTVSKASQTVALTAISDQTFAPARTVLATTSATSSLTPTLTSNDTDVCTVSGVVISLAKSGTCSITASQTGDDRYNPATSVTKTFQIAKSAQTITFILDDYMSLGSDGALDLNGSTTSGLVIDYTVADSTICDVLNGKLVGLAPGQCSITASQAGDDRYLANSVTRTLQVGSYVLVTSMEPIGSAITNSTATGFTVTFDADVTGFTASDLSTVPAGVCAIGEPASVNGSAAVYSVSLSNCGEGSVVLKLAADSVSNGAPGPKLETLGTVPVVFDRVFNQTVSVSPQFTSPTNRTSMVYNVTFNEAVTGFTAADVAFSGTGSANCSATVAGSGTSYSVTVTGCEDGNVIVSVNAASVSDLAGNSGPTVSKLSSPVTVDLTAPVAPQASGLPETYSRSSEFTVNFATDPANTYTCSLNGVALTGCDGSLVIPSSSMNPGDYTLEIWATDAAGNDSTRFSQTWTIGNYERPATPVINAGAFARTAFNRLTINWSVAAARSVELPVTGMVLEYSTNGTTWTAVETLAADATSYDLTMRSGYTYSFRVRALSGPFTANASDFSAVSTYVATYQPLLTAQSTPAALMKPAAGTTITLTGTDLRDFATVAPSATTGTVVTVTDSAGKAVNAALVSVTSTSIRFTVPTTSKIGTATVKVTVGAGAYATTSATRNIRIVAAKVNQVISFTAPGSTRVGDADTQLVATMDSAIVPTFVIEPGSIGICTVSTTGLLRPIKGGVCSYKVLAVGADAFNAFTSPVYNTTVNKLNVSMAFELPTELSSAFNQDGKLLLNPDLYQLVAVADPSIPNTTVNVSSAPETVCFVDGELKLHVIAIGTCTITALAENDFYRTEIPVTRAFEVVKSVQVLTYITPGASQNGVSAPAATDSISGFQLVATLNSGMLPNFESLNSEICTIDPSGLVNWVGDLVKTPGQLCEIRITQDGDYNYYGIEPVTVSFGGTHVPPLPPVGGYVREPDGALAVGRTGGLAASGNEGVAVVVVTGSKIAITPFSRGVYIGPITATVTIPYYVRVKNVLTLKQQICTIKWGILKKYRVGDPRAFQMKSFPNKTACAANKDAIAWFKTGARLLPTIVVKRDRKWPTTYLAKTGNNGKGSKIWPRIKTWHLTIG